MPMQYRRAIRWVLYALMVMLAFLAQSVVFGSNVFFSFKLDLVAVAAIGSTALYALDYVPADRMRLLIFWQFLSLLLSALFGLPMTAP